MEDKQPIRFSLGQFVILMGVGVVVLSLAFLLGARLGGQIFPEFFAKQCGSQTPLGRLAPEPPEGRVVMAPRSDKLVDFPEGEDDEQAAEDELGEDAPHIAVGADGKVEPVEDWEGEGAKMAEDYDTLTVNKSLIRTNADKDTVVRFKSSGSSKFTVEVADFFDELLASQRISMLKKKGLEAYLHIKNPGSRSPSYSVRVGVFADRKRAEDYAAQLATEQNLELRVVEMD